MNQRRFEVAPGTIPCQAYRLGFIEYARANNLQDRLVSYRITGEIPDTILILQHPSVFTIGVSGNQKDVVASGIQLDKEGIPVVHVDRGGKATYHGPGQLVGYLIMDLRDRERDIHQYVRNLEEVIIRTLRDFCIDGYRDSVYPGVWAEGNKICAVGIRVSRWVSKHGFALNVDTDLRYFTYITPCGVKERGVTSISSLLGHNITIGEVASSLLENCAHVFKMDITQKSPEQLDNYNG